jgi:hypothetical protein
MNEAERKRPWLAALLSSLIVGLGHFYLHRWKRALGWFTLLSGVVYLSGPSTVAAYANGTGSLWTTIPIFIVTLLATLDAYLVARVYNVRQTSPLKDTNVNHCPNCNRQVDASLDFCQWCTTELDHAVPEDE